MSCKNSTYCNCKTCGNTQSKSQAYTHKGSKMSVLPVSQIKQVLVLDANNIPMPNVYVSNLSKDKGTITNFDGKATIQGEWFDTIEVNHMTHDVEQYTFGELPGTVKLTNPHNLDEVTVIGMPKQVGVGIALALAGLGLLLTMKPQDTPQGMNAPKSEPVHVTL